MLVTPVQFLPTWTLSCVLALTIAIFLALSLLKPLSGYDTGWNIRMGQWIWENGRLPDNEPLLFTSAIPTPDFHIPGYDINESAETQNTVLKTHWLGQIIFYSVWSIDAIIGPIILRTLLFVAAVLSIIWTLRSLHMQWLWSLTGGIVGLTLLQGHIMARPSLFSIALVALSMALWVRFWITERKRWAWFAVALLPLWAQLHAGFVYGILLTLGWCAGLAGERLLAQTLLTGNNAWQRSPELVIKLPLGYIHLAILIIIAVVVPLFTYPPGLDELIGFLHDLARMPSMPDEMSPALFADEPLFFALAFGVVIVAIARWRYMPLPMWILLIAVTVAPFLAVRNISLFAAIGLPVLLCGFSHLVDLYQRTLASSHGHILSRACLGLLMLAVAIELIRTNPLIVNSAQPFTWNRALQPVPMARFIRQYPPPGRPMHPYHLGGYLALAVPEVQWFADGRYYKPRLIMYASASTNNSDLRQKMVDYYQIDWMIVPAFIGIKSKQLSMEFVNIAANPEWIPVTLLDHFGLFVRKTARTANYLTLHTMSYQNWHDSLLAMLASGGFGVMATQASHKDTWLALYLTLAGYIGEKGPNPNITAPKTILASVSPLSPGYQMSKNVLDALPLFQRRVSTMLALLPGGEAYAADDHGAAPNQRIK